MAGNTTGAQRGGSGGSGIRVGGGGEADGCSSGSTLQQINPSPPRKPAPIRNPAERIELVRFDLEKVKRDLRPFFSQEVLGLL